MQQVAEAPAPDAVIIDGGAAKEVSEQPAKTTEDAVRGALSQVRNKTEEAAAKLKGDDLPNKAASKPGDDGQVELSPQQKGAETRRKNREAAAKAEAEAAEKAQAAETKAKVKEAEARADAAEAKAAKAEAATTDTKTETPAEPSPGKEAPPQFSKEAKAEWESTPDSVKDQVWRLDAEAAKGVEKYRERADKYAAVEPYEQLAKAFNADLPTVLNDYKNMSELLRSDPVKGFEYLADRHGFSLTDLAEHVLGRQTNEGYKALENENVALRGEVHRLQGIEQQVNTERQNEMASHVDQARLDNPDFDELEPDIIYLLKTHEGLQKLPPQERLNAAILRARNMVGAPAPARTDLPASAETEAGTVARAETEAKPPVKGSATGSSAVSSGIPASAEDAVRGAFRKMRAR